MVVPLWRVHTGIGMGSERLVPWLLGRAASALGDEVEELVALHKKRFLDRADGLRPTEGARDFLDDLEDREVPFIIVTSSQGAETEALLAALGRDDLEIANADATEDTKPTPSPVLQACAQIGVDPAHATLVGDSPWDAESAVRAGASAAGVRCGGFSADALLQAGASLVVDDPRHLIGRL
jgi:HAD superfamily hydrolase (TIGR01549 family)